jgi:hypothetical protein
LERVELPEARGVEKVLALARQIVVHHALDDVHLLVLLLLYFMADCVELLYCRFEVDQLFIDVLLMIVRDLCTLLLKFLLVLSEKSTGYRMWGCLVSADKACAGVVNKACVIQLSSCQPDRCEF